MTPERPIDMCLCTQVIDLAKQADDLRDELLDLTAQAEALAAAQAVEQSARLAAKQPMLVEPISLPAQQGTHTCFRYWL